MIRNAGILIFIALTLISANGVCQSVRDSVRVIIRSGVPDWTLARGKNLTPTGNDSLDEVLFYSTADQYFIAMRDNGSLLSTLTCKLNREDWLALLDDSECSFIANLMLHDLCQRPTTFFLVSRDESDWKRRRQGYDLAYWRKVL